MTSAIRRKGHLSFRALEVLPPPKVDDGVSYKDSLNQGQGGVEPSSAEDY